MSGGPSTALPWWMGAAIVLVWLAVVASIAAIAIRRRRRRRTEARAEAHADATARAQLGTPERALPEGAPAPRELGPAK